MAIATGLLFGIFVIAGFGGTAETKYETVDATKTIAGHEIFVQSKFPTIIVDKIEFLDKPVQVTKEIDYNVWGSNINPIRYKVTAKNEAE